MKGIAFAPGHISSFFEPVYIDKNFDRTGSCGAGINISLGVLSHVTVEPTLHHTVVVRINGFPSNAPVTKLALKYLLMKTPLRVTVDTILDLPISQGFGMSAAGALSASLAVANLFHIPRENAVKAAHYAEVQLRTGLGDVVGSNFGGIEIRRKAGLPPWGMQEHIPGNFDMVLCIIGKEINTHKILSDNTQLHNISYYGRYCTKKLVENPSIKQLFSLGWKFTKKIAIADKLVLKAIEAANQHGQASMCMLGNSVYATGDTNKLCSTLARFGKIFCCSVDQQGARVLTDM
jgi:pantoate kinase